MALRSFIQKLKHFRLKLHGKLIEQLIHINQKAGLVLERGESLLNGRETSALHTTYPGHADQAFGHITYAQHGEDLILMNLFKILEIDQPAYLDIGAHHPFNISNTALLYARGSSGVNVEANPNLIDAFRKLRPRDTNVNVGISLAEGELDFYCIDDFSGRNTFDPKAAQDFVAMNPEFKIRSVLKIPTMTLNAIVDKYCNGIFPDFLSIDIEGLDLPVLKDVDFSTSHPKVICVEVVSGANTDISDELKQVLKQKDYSLYVKTIGNGIFIHNSLVGKLS